MKVIVKLPSVFLPLLTACIALLQTSFVAVPQDVASPTSTPSAVADLPQEDTGQFVQESKERKSFRPSFSSLAPRMDRLLGHKRMSPSVLSTFGKAVGPNWKASVRLILGGETQVALGCIVADDGWVISKSSQLPEGDGISCRLYDYREVIAKVVRRVDEIDLALLKIDAENLPTVVWSNRVPKRGAFVATADLKTTPSSVGVVSTGIQRIPRRPSVLGVNISDTRDGAVVTHVLQGTGAELAGLRMNDSIFEVNGVGIKTLSEFKKVIADAIGGDQIDLKVSRGSNVLEVQTHLMDLSAELYDDTEMEVNGHISARATGFERVFLHDSVIEPNQCGGALVNLDGEVVGINIARAGRVTSYALPVDAVQPVVDGLIAEAKLVSRRSDQESNSLR